MTTQRQARSAINKALKTTNERVTEAFQQLQTQLNHRFELERMLEQVPIASATELEDIVAEAEDIVEGEIERRA